MTDSATAPDRLLDEDEATHFASLRPYQLAQLRADGAGPPFILVKRQPLYERATLRDWCAARLINKLRNSTR
jgi:hypothetical protein